MVKHEILNVPKASRIFDMSPSSLLLLILSGQIEARKIGRKWFTTYGDLVFFVRNGAAEQAAIRREKYQAKKAAEKAATKSSAKAARRPRHGQRSARPGKAPPPVQKKKGDVKDQD
jgi:hypothetical protein